MDGKLEVDIVLHTTLAMPPHTYDSTMVDINILSFSLFNSCLLLFRRLCHQPAMRSGASTGWSSYLYHCWNTGIWDR